MDAVFTAEIRSRSGIVAVLTVLSLLWLSSYIVLRALHVYLGTPFNELALWKDSTVQLSFTLLWVSLAFMSMSLASRKKITFSLDFRWQYFSDCHAEIGTV